MYRMRIKRLNGEWRVADMGADSPAITYEEAQLGEMALKGNGSQSLLLPLTPTNISIFEGIHVPTARSRVPYSRLECRLYHDGIEIMGEGSYCILMSVEEGYNVTLVSGNIDIFERMKNLTSDTNPSCLGVVRMASLSSLDGSAVFVDGSRNVRTTPTGGVMPAISLSSLRERIASATGIAMNSKSFPDNRYLTFATRKRANALEAEVPFDSVTPMKEDWTIIDGSPTNYQQGQTRWTGGWVPSDISKVGIMVRVCVARNNTSYTSVQAKIQLYIGTKSKPIWWRFSGTPLANGFVEGVYISGREIRPCYQKDIYFWSDGSATDKDGHTFAATDYQGFTQDDVEWEVFMETGVINPTHVFSAQWNGNTSSQRISSTETRYTAVYPSGMVQIQFQPLCVHTDETAAPYEEVNILEGLGYKNVLELYKALATTYATFTHLDNRSKTLQQYRIGDVVANKGAAADWSDKFVGSSDTFSIDGFARHNHYSFTENNEYTLDKVIVCEDENLQDTNTTTIQLLSPSTNGKIAWWDEDGKFTKLAFPHLLIKNGNLMMFADVEELDWYDEIADLLYEPRVVTAKVLLNAVDILNFTHTQPVYLRQYGSFFYVTKISNWMIDHVCEAQLVRL